MQHILHILMRYRYLILASLSLLLISEMVVVDIDSVPVEYEWIFRCLVALTMVAWTGILCVIGYGPPIDRAVVKRTSNIYAPDSSVIDALEDEPKRRGHIVLVLSPALFVMFALLSILGAILFQAQFLLEIIGPYWPVFFMVWIGMVVIVGATVNVDSSKKTYLVMNVFPLLVLVWIMLYAVSSWIMLYMVVSSESEVWYGVMYLFGGLVVFLSYFLIVRAVVLRTMLPDKYSIRLAVISFGISVVLSAVSFMPVMIVASMHSVLLWLFPLIIAILMSLTISVPLTILIGMVGRPIRNITVVGIGIVPMIVLFVVYWFNIR